MLRGLARQAWSLGQQLGDPRNWPHVPSGVLAYARDLIAFRGLGSPAPFSGPMTLEPVLFQRRINSPFDPHYVYQGAWATRHIARAAPPEHVDVSSQVSFVAQLAAIVPVTMFEFHAPSIRLPGLTVREGTVLALPLASRSVVSLSCLHVVEHVGLGRYGDPLDPAGMARALRELARVLAVGGSLYLSVPVGKPHVAFNAHRVVKADDVVDAMSLEGLALTEFALVDDQREFLRSAPLSAANSLSYGCGLFLFSRTAA